MSVQSIGKQTFTLALNAPAICSAILLFLRLTYTSV
nr:unnamed protein product [Callosobruchus analis]